MALNGKPRPPVLLGTGKPTERVPRAPGSPAPGLARAAIARTMGQTMGQRPVAPGAAAPVQRTGPAMGPTTGGMMPAADSTPAARAARAAAAAAVTPATRPAPAPVAQPAAGNTAAELQAKALAQTGRDYDPNYGREPAGGWQQVPNTRTITTIR